MPTQYIGATVEPTKMHMWSLFGVEREMRAEIERRAWKYIRALGYRPYREIRIEVSFEERGRGDSKIQLVKIVAVFEQDHSPEEVNIEVPYKLFETAVPHAPAGEA